MYIDSHCHLNHKRLLNIGPPADIVSRANAAEVRGMLTICCRISDEFPDVLAVARAHENVWCTIGTHPHDAGDPAERMISQDELAALARSDEKIIGIGESGLDYFYKNSEPKDQQESFRRHIRACIETGLPLIVHSRDADDDTMRIIREEGAGTDLKGVLHCFSSGRAMGENALDFGFYISLSGIVTFPKSRELQDFARDVPLDRILIETDAPYLAPEPFRGKINEPAMISHTCAVVAGLKGIEASAMADHTARNFFTLFNKAHLQ
ncbi:MAG TPA: TatD family hydrolase [Micavibrio sp.]|jgi:TatD DNase family protein